MMTSTELMQTTEILAEEHRWIRRMVDCLEELVERSKAHGRLDYGLASELLDLFESFADGLHQEKEETHLFPHLLRRANAAEADYIRRLLEEHVHERSCMLGMRSNLLGAIHGEPLCLREFARLAESYVELHRKHMANENAIVLPMAERILTASDDVEIVEGFDALATERARTVAGSIDRIEAKFGRLGDAIEEEPSGSR